MAEHLTAQDAQDYRSGKATPEALLAWDDHLAECAECRERLASRASMAEWARGLEGEEATHLTREQIVAKAEGRIADAERFPVEAHLRECAPCREEVEDLAAFRSAQAAAARGGPVRKTRPMRWVVPMAAALVLGIFAWRRFSAPGTEFPATWSAEDRALVEKTLEAGALPRAMPPRDVGRRAGVLLGTAKKDAFAVIAPMGVILETDRPKFEWQALQGATKYSVEVFDSNFNPVASSGLLEGTSWVPEKPLPRGELYHWQVTAMEKGKPVTVPAPPAPEADFRVLSQEILDRITRAHQSGAEGHVLAAALYAQAGMDEEAKHELEQVPAELRARPEFGKLFAPEGKK